MCTGIDESSELLLNHLQLVLHVLLFNLQVFGLVGLGDSLETRLELMLNVLEGAIHVGTPVARSSVDARVVRRRIARKRPT